MKKHFIIVIVFLIGVGLSASVLQAQTLPASDAWSTVKTKQKGTLVCLWNHAYGLAYKANDGKLTGVCVDILADFTAFIKTNYNCDLKLHFVEEPSFSNFLKRVSATPNLLGVSSVSITEERKKFLQFTPPYLSNPNVIVTNQEVKPLTSLNELATVYKGFKLKLVEGSVHDIYAKKIRSSYYPDLIIEHAPSSKMIFEEMVNNKNIFTIIDFAEYLGVHRDKKELSMQNVDLDFIDKLGFVLHKQSDWGELWQEFLTDEYRKSAGYKKIISQNLGATYLAMINKLERTKDQ